MVPWLFHHFPMVFSCLFFIIFSGKNIQSFPTCGSRLGVDGWTTAGGIWDRGRRAYDPMTILPDWSGPDWDIMENMNISWYTVFIYIYIYVYWGLTTTTNSWLLSVSGPSFMFHGDGPIFVVGYGPTKRYRTVHDVKMMMFPGPNFQVSSFCLKQFRGCYKWNYTQLVISQSLLCTGIVLV